MNLYSSEFMNEIESVVQRLREVESMSTNLETAIEYESPDDHKCHSDYSISRSALELIS